ncbi:MAG: hypothetical protein KF764_30690 [Labilithrix sp.]|nr:hypothetical protein [Labilithrix sp.]MBX3219600.1 hypothetical protein [Labilithrix sp.]
MHRNGRLAIFLGGALVATFAFLAACSTDNGSTPLPGQNTPDSGRDTKKDGSENGDDDDDDVTEPKDGGTPDCSAAPKLRSNDKGFYCTFFTRDAAAADASAAAGGNRNCGHDETCCNPGRGANNAFPPSFCAATPRNTKGGDNGATECAAQATANGTTWNATGGTTWECNDKNNCAAGETCCMFSAANLAAGDKVNLGPLQGNTVPKECNALQAFKQGGTRCATSCSADEIQLCSQSDDNCTGNQKCTPFSGLFRDLGACRQ